MVDLRRAESSLVGVKTNLLALSSLSSNQRRTPQVFSTYSDNQPAVTIQAGTQTFIIHKVITISKL